MPDLSAFCAPSVFARLWGKTIIAVDCQCRLCKVTNDPAAKCLTWMGGKTNCGYGRIRVDGRSVLPHRFVYELLVEAIPEGRQLDHLCKIRSCLNVAHLEPVSARENLLRGDTFNARNATKTHCIRGHEFTPENTRITPPRKRNPNGQRECITCRRVRRRAWYAQQKAQRSA